MEKDDVIVPNRAPGSVWALRLSSLNTYVSTGDNETINIIGPCDGIDNGHGLARLTMSRRDAKLLAKRITQCLEGTKR